MKKLLVERFQELAGIKPLDELSPELKAKAAMAAKSQGRNQQADRFGKSYGEEEQDDSAFKAFIGKELGAREDYMIKITNIDIEEYGLSIVAYGKVNRDNLHIQIHYRMSDDAVNVETLGDSERLWKNIGKQFFNRQSINTIKSMVKIINPESKLVKAHWASFPITGAGIFKESIKRKKLAESVLKMTKILLSKRTLNESVDLKNIMQGDKFKEGVFLNPSKSYGSMEEIEQQKLKPTKIVHTEATEKYTEAYHLHSIRPFDNSTQVYSIEGRQAPFDNNREGEVVDLITYEEAIKKNERNFPR